MDKTDKEKVFSFMDIRRKQVINEKSCKIIGCVCNLEFDECGCVRTIFVPGPAKHCGIFGRDSNYAIPFCNVISIGEDIILVCIDEKECLRKNSRIEKKEDIFFM